MTDMEKLAAIAHSPEAETLRAMIADLGVDLIMAHQDFAYVGGSLARWQQQYPAPTPTESEG